ncbi:hypothetical protein [Tsukamurella sp. 1534]|uniref:hypothetical protein n=1 Tax=Tsukamurella sp. 1534 TaxID=1151061 RepID=UPI0002F22687|nr:hypothetical protein [Tsukamurella sp. 1534]
MTDALIVGAIFVAIVLTTQIGYRRHTTLLAVMPFVTSAIIGYLILGTGEHHYVSGDGALAIAGAAAGVMFGLALNPVMDVRRDPERGGRLYTRAGWAYLGIWLLVLGGRCVFVAALERSPAFATRFGEFLDAVHGGPDGVGAFFLLAALGMSLTREVAILVRARRIPRPPIRMPDRVSEPA